MVGKETFMRSMTPAIIVVAFNRPKALRRLLNSLRKADYSGYSDIPLVISIDRSDHQDVVDVASSTVWGHGGKRVITHHRHLGLRNHIIACGNLSEEYGAVIIFEDDLVVSPVFYDYAVQAIRAYEKVEKVGGLSLYSYEFNAYADMRFIPINDGYDNYFVQTASSLGQIWTRAQWVKFKQWYDKNAIHGVWKTDLLPHQVTKWPESSWKKYFMKYMVEEGTYFVFPRFSLTTDFGDDGAHTRGMGNLLQVPMLMKRKIFHFSQLEDSSAVYDVFFEPTAETFKRLCPEYQRYHCEFDFYGTKDLNKVNAEYLFSSKKATEAIKQFGNEMVPPVSNVVYEVPGSFYSFARKETYSALSGWRRLQMIYSQQRILNGVTALALGAYRFYCLFKMLAPHRVRKKEETP